MKQITIYDLLPLLNDGYVAMDKSGFWYWYGFMPKQEKYYWMGGIDCIKLQRIFNIAPFDGDWKDSLIKVEHSKKKSIDRKDFDDFIEQHGVSPWGFLTEAILKEDFECWKKRRHNDKDTY